MDVEVPVLAGYLNVQTQSGFPLHRIAKKKPCQKYCLLFKSSRYGIERLEIFETREDKNPKIITLENCVKITQEPPPANIICIVKKTGSLTLNAINEEDLKEWVNALQTVAFRNKNDASHSLYAIEEDNDLYCSSYGDGLFIVTLIPSAASKRCNIDPKAYMLQLTATELQLRSVGGLKQIVSTWPYRFIRKYGYRDGKFTFEAGRKCSTGEGVFILDHSNPQEVFRCMSSKMKCMKKLISGDIVSVDNCENILIAAASMEPGSRSPLPTTLSTPKSSDFELYSNHTFKGSSTADPFNSYSQIIIKCPKVVPSKPPRKTIPANENVINPQSISPKIKNYSSEISKCSFETVTITSTVDPNKSVGSTVILKPPSPNSYFADESNFEQMSSSGFSHNADVERDYECIEDITDAWKTMGINEVNHNETINKSDSRTTRFRDKIGQMRNMPKAAPYTVATPKIIDIDIGENNNRSSSKFTTNDYNYDRLNFLSANNKSSSGYKTVVCVTSIPNQGQLGTPDMNDYELIGVIDTELTQLDDGPQMTLKAATPPHNIPCNMMRESDALSKQQAMNELNYAQINKSN